jgi:hypothetical protein
MLACCFYVSYSRRVKRFEVVPLVRGPQPATWIGVNSTKVAKHINRKLAPVSMPGAAAVGCSPRCAGLFLEDLSQMQFRKLLMVSCEFLPYVARAGRAMGDRL